MYESGGGNGWEGEGGSEAQVPDKMSIEIHARERRAAVFQCYILYSVYIVEKRERERGRGNLAAGDKSTGDVVCVCVCGWGCIR